ncbi:helix-turn-helix transcriptional regulator [Marivivens sp. LCG002]|uniref:helix-turn-helix domain-containing protein n=1 Tax=Marivivens sp. LCG002 TaxID=3051171 RepID=UPI002554CCC4|nr:helix-turn-helix transcriptional regulator [Marivivens sp. LCG002]WIV52182.1 helix-turn-helix transcriptional regulator [Marivivens sp. LCG002]
MSHPVDLHVANQIRNARVMRGMTQSALAKHIGCSFQQLQKYETGQNRVSASRLHDIAIALGLPVAHFFEGYEGGEVAPLDNQTQRIFFALSRLKSEEVKETLCRMVTAIAEEHAPA